MDLLPTKRKHLIKSFPVFLLIITIVFAWACQSKKTADAPADLAVVKAPADGVITKVLVTEGAKIGKDAPIVEIEPSGEIMDAPPKKDLNNPGAMIQQNGQNEVDAAQTKVERASIEMQRMETLIASGSAPQAQLDAARADFQKAQDNLQAAKDREKSRETQKLIEKSRGVNSAAETVSPPKIATARTSASGILKVLNARVGQKVKTGQILATVEKD